MTARDGKKREAGFTRRLLLATTIQGVALAGLGYRLYTLQVPRQDDFLEDSFEIRTVTRYDAPTRGIIVDRFGRQLALGTLPRVLRRLLLGGQALHARRDGVRPGKGHALRCSDGE